MSEQMKLVEAWWEDAFPFDLSDDDEMNRLHTVLPNGYFIAIDMSVDNDEKHVMLLENEHE